MEVAKNVAHQGTAIAAIKLLASNASDQSPLVLGVLTIIFSVATPLIVMFCVWRYVTADFMIYDFEIFRDGKFNGPVRYLFPFGTWIPEKMRIAYGL